MKVKVSEASGVVLDFLVSKASNPPGKDGWGWWERDEQCFLFDPLNECRYSPSTDWSQGGPIIEREHLEVSPTFSNTAWVAGYPNNPSSKQYWSNGHTPLIAALRCYVVSELGEEVEVPDELI